MFRTMISLEPATVTKRRYPLLFQTGESAFGRHIVDGQHPHDLFMELQARYDYAFNDGAQFFIYGGPVAEPALGPTAFPHRASASEIPSAVSGITHQDSTHISNSVITLGLSEDRYNWKPRPSTARSPMKIAGISIWDAGFIRVPPDIFSRECLHRAILHGANQQQGAFGARTGHACVQQLRCTTTSAFRQAMWRRVSSGEETRISISDERRIFNAYTLESTVNFGRNWAWTRIENADRDATLLAGETEGHADETPIGRVQAWTFGYERELPTGLRQYELGLAVK